MASHPQRYPELASYRDTLQLANRRWPPVYLFGIQARMAYAIKIFHALPWVPGTLLARFPVLSWLRLTVEDVSAFGQFLQRKFPPHGRKTPANAKSFDHIVKDRGFTAPEQMEERRPEM